MQVADVGKSIFIMTSAGKPVFSYDNRPESELVNLFSFLQAIISVVASTGDEIKTVTAGDTKIVFIFKKSLYFIISSKHNEPESMLARQLDFLYQNIVFILTAKVHDLIANNPAIDLRDLLGSDSDRILTCAGCNNILTPLPVAFHALPLMLTEKALRDDINSSLNDTVDTCGAACGILIQDGVIVSYQQNTGLGLSFGIADLVLLTNFVENSQSLKTNEQSWIPICLPEINGNGYLQAYVANTAVELESVTSNFVVVLIAVSAEPQELQNLIKGKNYLVKRMKVAPNAGKVPSIQQFHATALNNLRDDFGVLHFLFRFMNGIKTAKTTIDFRTDIAFLVQSTLAGRVAGTAFEEKMWTEYQHLALRLRKATSRFEVTGFPAVTKPPVEVIRSRALSLYVSGNQQAAAEVPPVVASKDFIDPVTDAPKVDHALSIVTAHGFTFIAFANMGCEIFVSFPDVIPIAEATKATDRLCQALKAALCDISGKGW